MLLYFGDLNCILSYLESEWTVNKVIRKVRKTQHQKSWVWFPKSFNPNGTGWDLRKPAKKYISIQQRMKLKKISIVVVNWVSCCLSFCLNASTAATYIFTAPNCTTTTISLKPCALNAAEYPHLIISCSISYWDLSKCLYFADTNERGDRGWKEAQRQGEEGVTLRITLMCNWYLQIAF